MTATPAPVTEWCDLHHGYVDEGRTAPLSSGSEYRMCDACADSSSPSTVTTRHLDSLLTILSEPGLSLEDRAASYAVLHQIQLRINRALRPVKDEVVAYLREQGGRSAAIGPLTLKSVAVDPRYPCNDPGNWDDIGVQDAMAGLRSDADTRPYVRHVPDHLEIDPLALGADVMAGLAAAHRLFRELKLKGWRTEAGRRYSLDVRPARSTK